jgi:uncharacterized protein YqgC (DUF456 family)
MAGHLILWSALALAWLSTLLGAPGAALMLAVAAVYGWATGFHEVTWSTLGWLAAIAVPAEVIDQGMGFWFSRRYGATWVGLAGGFAGGVVGASLLGGALPVIGIVPGALLGSFAGAYLGEYAGRRDPSAALRAAWGSFLGRIAGIVLKLAAGVMMAGVIYRAV